MTAVRETTTEPIGVELGVKAGLPAPSTTSNTAAVAPAASDSAGAAGEKSPPELLSPGFVKDRFIPVSRFDLAERLTQANIWPNGQSAAAKRFFRFLEYWRQQTYHDHLRRLEEAYQPFSPDSDLLRTRQWTRAERLRYQNRLIRLTRELLERANFEEIARSRIDLILTPASTYGLDLTVDLDDFEELILYFRGATTQTQMRRCRRKLYLYKEEFDFPVYQRFFILFKLKQDAARIEELMQKEGLGRRAAARQLRKLRSRLPASVVPDNIYLKLFKNIPRDDLEMLFPNTRVRLPLIDKLKLSAAASGSIGSGVYALATKVALLTTAGLLVPVIALVGFCSALVQQVMNYFNTHQHYMATMARNLYFQSLADNRGVMTLLADRGDEEDIKEEMLLYTVLAKEPAKPSDLQGVKTAVEQYLLNTFGADVRFDVDDALRRLKADGIVSELSDGSLQAMPPEAAAEHLDQMWDKFLDTLTEREMNRDAAEDALDSGTAEQRIATGAAA